MRIVVFLPLFVLVCVTNANAQEQPLQPGQRVRVTVPNQDLSGHQDTFRQLRGDTLVLESMWLPFDDVTRLEVHVGQQSRTGRGAGLGALSGLGFGVGLAAIGHADCGTDEPICDIWWIAAVPSGVVLGALVGAIVGSQTKADKWEEVPLDRLQVSVMPQRGGRIAFAMSVSF